jgi:hypothetical protein
LAGGTRPDPTLAETVAHLLTFMVREGIIPAPPVPIAAS